MYNFNNEDEFQAEVNADLRKLGIPFRHRYKSKGRKGQALNTFVINGVKMAWLDNAIYLPNGRCIYVELKHGNGKLSDEQTNFIQHFKMLGYSCYVANKWTQWGFIKRVEGIGENN